MNNTDVLKIQIDFLEKCAKLFYRKKMYAQAEGLYRTILSKGLNNPHALKGLGSCLFRMNLYDVALRCFEGLKKISPSPEEEAWRYACLYKLGKKEEAELIASQLGSIDELLKKEGLDT